MYFDPCKSIRFADGPDCRRVLQTVADRYIGRNPARPFIFRLSSANGFRRNTEYRYLFPLEELFPEAKNEQSVYAWAKLWSDGDHQEQFLMIPHGPAEVYVNGGLVFRSNYYQEKTKRERAFLSADFISGWNSVVLRFRKTPLGFGGEFGTASFKAKPYHFLAPTPERNGQEGFIFTKPMEELSELPRLDRPEGESPVRWLPACRWNADQEKLGQFVRIYGKKPGCYGFGWTKLFSPAASSCTVSGTCESPLTLYLGSRKILESPAGAFHASFPVPAGFSDLAAESLCENDGWGFRLAVNGEDGSAALQSPCGAKGTDDPWIYAGPFAEKQEPQHTESLWEPFQTVDGDDYWRADLPGMYVRPFLETPNFANWNYPVGVTLYGLLKAADTLHRADIAEYVKEHVELCSGFYRYALWDKQKFGAPGIDAQLAAIESLDDCGSFASTMLETNSHMPVRGARQAADAVADYISHRQARLPDGSLYRYLSSMAEMKNTMWLDDLYMSTPFLGRYYLLTGDRSCLDDAARQFLLFREKMMIPGKNILSHVYYTDLKIANGIPWGRGNGWVLFSLSEILAVMPEDHELRGQLLDFFRDLCRGYADLQDGDGLWHQVLTDPESYAESSCSSMFVCAFARGVRHGWLPDSDFYARAALRGWEGLTRCCIDADGNIYGICRGSGHSFTPHYYKDDLGWILNDTHGIGVLLLAGVEIEKMAGAVNTNVSAGI